MAENDTTRMKRKKKMDAASGVNGVETKGTVFFLVYGICDWIWTLTVDVASKHEDYDTDFVSNTGTNVNV